MKKLILILGCVLALAACDNKKEETQEKPVVKIGAILPLTGGGAVLGASLKAGTLAAIEDKEKKNLKYHYEAIFEDNQQQPAKSATAANKLIASDKVNVLLTFTTGSGRVIAPIAQNAGLLNLVATLEDENAEPMGQTTFWQGPTLQSYQRILINALKKRGVKKLALLAAHVGVACAGTEHLTKLLAKKGMDVQVECFNPSDRDFRLPIQKYVKEGYEYFYLQFFPPQTDIVVRQLYEQNILPQHIFGSGIDTGADISLFENINHVGGNSGTPEFIDRLMNEYHIDNVYMAASAYDLVSLAVDAFENAEDIKNIDEITAYIKEHATRKCLSGECKLFPNGFIANEAEWRTYINGKPIPLKE
ncbi:MAG: ABC transporter substrate-binding protein [Alphaproteobacteria bacterium]|nr:ABC transporter substrate-binding protein [Alphaproteobacteria bacterium]